MSLTQINLKPYWDENTIERMDVTIKITGLSYKEGERLCSMQLSTVTIPGCEPNALQICDESGAVLVKESEETPYPYHWRRWNVQRGTEGNVKINYTVYPREIKPTDICGPYFDFRAEKCGANSAGLSFLMDIEKAEECELSWDMSAMPEKSRGVCTLGEHKVKAKTLDRLRECYFAMGQLNAIEEGDFGFYWMSKPPFDVKEVAEYTKKLFSQMQKFFKDTEKVYRIFVRKDPFLTSGGTALYRSYLFGWNTTQPCSLEDKKAILAHEMVHNWPQLNDNPYGVTTWYSEGTAEYYSVLLPLRLGLMTDDEAILELQKRTDAYYSNPTRVLGDEEAAAICWKDRRAQRLVYGRGMIFIINTDIMIRKATNGAHSIDDVVLDILQKDRAGIQLGNEVFLTSVKKISGLDVRSEWEDMHTGKEIIPLSGGFDGHFAVVEKEIDEADTGKKVRSWTWIKQETKKGK